MAFGQFRGEWRNDRPGRWLVVGLLALALIVTTVACLERSEPRTWLLARNTCLLAWGAMAIAVPLGTLAATILFRADCPGRRVALWLLTSMLFVPLYVQAAAWQAGFGRLGWWMLLGGIAREPLLASWRAAIWIHGVAAIPAVTLIVGIGLRAVERAAEESALLDASPLRVLLWVTLPRAAPACLVAALWGAVTTAGEMTVTDLFQVRTYAEELYTGFALGDDLGQATLGALPGILISTWLAVAAAMVVAWMAPAMATRADRPAPTFLLGGWRWLIAVIVWSIVLLVVAVPLVNLALKAGVVSREVDGKLMRSWSAAIVTRNVARIPFTHGRAFQWTIVIGGLSATLAVGVGLLLAWWARRGGPASLPALATAAVALAVPPPLVALLMIRILNQPSLPWLVDLYDRTVLAPVLVTTIRALPWTILLAWFALRSLDPSILDAAAMDGAGSLGTLLRVAVPARFSAIVVAWVVALAVTSGDLAASTLVLPPGVETVPRAVFGLLHSGVRHEESSLCLVMAAISFAMAAFTLRMAPTPPDRWRE